MAVAGKPKGRPSIFTAEVAATICQRLAKGETLRAICRDEDLPEESTVRAWVIDNREGFYAQYTRAREIGYQLMADELLEISDDGRNDWMERQSEDGTTGTAVDHEHINRSRLRVDTRKWMLSKALPKIYGDKIAHEIGDPDGKPLAPTIILTGRPGGDADTGAAPASKAVGGTRKSGDRDPVRRSGRRR